MAEKGLEAIRKELSKKVPELWTEHPEAKEDLRKKAEELIADIYEMCATKPYPIKIAGKEAKTFRECVELAAKEKGLSKAYKELWGTA